MTNGEQPSLVLATNVRRWSMLPCWRYRPTGRQEREFFKVRHASSYCLHHELVTTANAVVKGAIRFRLIVTWHHPFQNRKIVLDFPSCLL